MIFQRVLETFQKLSHFKKSLQRLQTECRETSENRRVAFPKTPKNQRDFRKLLEIVQEIFEKFFGILVDSVTADPNCIWRGSEETLRSFKTFSERVSKAITVRLKKVFKKIPGRIGKSVSARSVFFSEETPLGLRAADREA